MAMTFEWASEIPRGKRQRDGKFTAIKAELRANPGKIAKVRVNDAGSSSSFLKKDGFRTATRTVIRADGTKAVDLYVTYVSN